MDDLAVMFDPGHVQSIVDASVDYYEARRTGDVASANAALARWNMLRVEAGMPVFFSDVSDEDIASNDFTGQFADTNPTPAAGPFAARPNTFPPPDVQLPRTQSNQTPTTAPPLAAPPETHDSTLDPPRELPKPEQVPVPTLTPTDPPVITSRQLPSGPAGDLPMQIKIAATSGDGQVPRLNPWQWNFYFQQLTGREGPDPQAIGFADPTEPVTFESWWNAFNRGPDRVVTQQPEQGISSGTLILVGLVVLALVLWK